MATTVTGAATPTTTHPDTRAYRLHLALSGLSLFTDGMPDTYITMPANQLWAIFAVLADETERLYQEIIAS